MLEFTRRIGFGVDVADFLELEGALQCDRVMQAAALLGSTSAIVVNLPAPAAYAVGKLLVAAERTGDSRSKTKKDIAQAAALIDYFLQRDPDSIVEMIAQTRARGPAWRKSLDVGLEALRRAWPRVGESMVAATGQRVEG